MMATAESPGSSSFLPLLESIEDNAAGQSEQTDAYLTIANRLSGEEGRQFLPAVEKHFCRFGKATLAHIASPNTELCQAALQALGFCVYHSNVVSDMPETLAAEILSVLGSLVMKSTDKNTCTRALWVISKQNFPPDIVAKGVPPILGALESVWTREDVQSVVMEHEAINVVIRLLDQVPAAMVEGAVRWAKFVIPLVVHSASKVRLRAAAAMEMGMPLLLEKQTEVAAIIEPMMSTKLVPELQKLFMTKNETNVLKLWPLFVKLLGKLLHKGGPFINSLLHLEELGFRSSSPSIKKIAFIAWKSLIDNFALNPDILCSSKRVKLLMQPLMSIHVRTEALLLTKVEVWWYLGVKLGPNLSSNFDQVSVPLLQYSIGSDHSSVSGTPSRAVSQNGAVTPGTTGFNSPGNTSRMSLNSSVQNPSTFPSIQLLGLEMLLHFFMGPEVIASAAKNKVTLSLEPMNHPLLTGASSFTKHAAVLTSNIRDGFINIGKEASESLLKVIWTNLVRFVNLTIESGSKKDRHGCEVLTSMLLALQSIVTSEDLPADKILILFEATVNGIPYRVLGSASYQVGKMDVLNGTPALFLIHLLYNSSMLSAYIEDERFFQCLKTLVHCGLSGPTSPLAFGEAVLGAIGRSAGSVQNKDQLWKMWNVVVGLLTDSITQSNEVNQGDALEHNFSAMHSALLFPITHLLPGIPMQQATQKLMLSTWSKLYKVFARCSALVVTAEENICCEELCAKMTATMDGDNLTAPLTLNIVTNILQVMVECVDFSPYTPQFQQKLKSPHTPRNWMKKRNRVLGNLSTFHCLLVKCLKVYLEDVEGPCEATGLALISILSALFTNLALTNIVKEALTSLIQPLTLFFKHAASEPPKFSTQLLGKLEKILVEVLGCLQTRSALAYDDELLTLLSPLLCVLFPHKNKQFRTSTAHFWNSTFANSANITYPSEIRPILSQVKQKTPIILPGFEVVSVPDELSGQYSSESSLLETKISGMPISSAGKRESNLGKASELKDKLVSTKLDFGSPNPPLRNVLEEEASIDFVFIPPETKERVLTEHQKEMKRTKRVDIPAMYNNLDASLDTTVFTQFTQSQDNSLDKLPPEQADKITEEAFDKVPPEDLVNKEDTEVLKRKTQDDASRTPVENMSENQDKEAMITESAHFSKEDYSKSEDKVDDITMESKESTSPNNCGSSDLISGTPQKPNSRRQSFITLEKYAEGMLVSPSSALKFTGPLIKSSNSHEYLNTHKTTPSLASEKSEPTVKDPLESPIRPNDSSKKVGPVRLIERMSCDTTEDDIIPDTQTEVEQLESTEMASEIDELKTTNPDENSEHTVDDSQSSLTEASPEEPRRSGRCRVRPLLPGENPVERDERYMLAKRRRSEEKTKADSPKLSSVQSGPKTRSMQAEEHSSSLRTRAQRDKRDSSQTNSQERICKRIKLFNNPAGCLDNLEPRRRRIRESSQTDSPSDSQSDHESQSKHKHRRRRKSSFETMEENGMNKKALGEKVELLELVQQTEQKKDDKPQKVSQIVNTSTQTNGESPVSEFVEQTVNGKSNTDSEMDFSSQSGGRSQEFELEQKIKQPTHCQIVTSPANDSQDETSQANNLANDLEVKDETIHCTVDNLSQENSQVITPPSSDGPSLRRSRRSKTLESAESEDNSENKASSVRQTRSISHAALPAVCHAEALIGGRTRRSKVEEAQSNPESSHSLDNGGSTDSSQGRGRNSRRRSSQVQVTNVDSLECESSEHAESTPVHKKRGRKPGASLLSPFTIDSKEDTNNDIVESDFEMSEKVDVELIAANTQCSELLQLTHDIEEKVKVLPSEAVDKSVTNESKELSVSHPKTEQGQHDVNEENESLEASDTLSFKSAETIDSVGTSTEQNPDMSLNGPSAVEILFPSCEATEKLQTSLVEKAEDVSESGENVAIKDNDQCQQEYPVVPIEDAVEDGHSVSVEQDLMGCPNIIDDLSKEQERLAAIKEGKSQNQGTPLQESDKGEKTQVESEDEEETISVNEPANVLVDSGETKSETVVQASPVKQRELEAIVGPDMGHSPSSGRTRGTWSPSASPSTSILKKGQKRPPEDETPSPLLKSRRVSFANPIQHQETADDIDRRSPAIRTSSPRRSKISNIPQSKYVTTPTKGLLVLSPRNLHSPGFKSSKKCLISEMSQEPRLVSKDCIYPALVGCSTPVEAVLSHISSNMWSRGFGQLVRAKNIKTVGDLSSLTPAEIKTLPIRSPKISNVKKALKIYEQRKGRGGDELKSFDEIEITSDLHSNFTQNQDEKSSGETLATELIEDPVPVDGRLERDNSRDQMADTLTGDRGPEGQLHLEGLTLGVEALCCRFTPLELSSCSSQQLVQIHDQLGGMMRNVVVELQTRLCQTDAKP